MSWEQIVLGSYGVLLLIGGIIGYVKAKSMVSLGMGIVSAGIAGVSFFLTQTQPILGFGLGATVGLVLTVVFVGRLIKTQKFMPAGVMAILSGIAAIVCGLALLPV